VLTLLRQLRYFGELLELFRVRSEHHADDLVGALQVHRVRSVVGRPFSGRLVAQIGQIPPLGGLDQHAVRKGVSYPQRRENGEVVGRIFIVPEVRQLQLGEHPVAELVRRHEQHVADHELDQRGSFRGWETLETRLICGNRLDDLADARLERWRTRWRAGGWRGLREQRAARA
jgi:hypothetical protein